MGLRRPGVMARLYLSHLLSTAGRAEEAAT